MEIKIEEALERIKQLEMDGEGYTNQINYLREFRNAMGKVYPIEEIDGAITREAYDKLCIYATTRKLSLNRALEELINNTDEK